MDTFFRKYQNWIGFFLIVLGLYFITRYALPWFWPIFEGFLVISLPFILSMFLAMIFDPIVTFLERRFRINRLWGTALTMTVILGGLVLVLALITIRLIFEIGQLAKSLPQYRDQITDYLHNLTLKAMEYYEQGAGWYQTLPLDVQQSILENIKAIAESLERFLRLFINWSLNFIQHLPGGLTSFIFITIVILIATFFLTKDSRLIRDFWLRTAPKPFATNFLRVFTDVFNAFGRYIKAMFILINLTMVQSIIGLYIIGAEYALLMGLFIGFMDLIPVMGPSAVFLPWIIWSYFAGQPIFALKLLILYIVIISIRQVMETKVVSDSLGMHPLVTLVSMYVGLKLIGFLGLILGPILVIAIQSVVKSGVIKIKL